MNPEQIAELEKSVTAAESAAAEAGGSDEALNKVAQEAKDALAKAQALSQDPVKNELEKARRSGKTEADKAAFSLKKNAERVKELGLNPEEILGISRAPVSEDDDRPMTVAEFKRLEAERAQKTALQMAENISDENERELTKHYLQTRVRPSGNPEEDLRFARAAVNSIKNGQIVEELSRKPEGQGYGTGSGGPAKRPEAEFKPTEEEAKMMASFGLTKDHILRAREAQK